ncbi:thiamine diphosphokinase [Halovulum sp. GXIMD14794]
MPEILLDTPDNITLVGGSAAARPVLSRALALAPVLVAADGGIAHALACGHHPVAVIGDMDSLPNGETWRNSDIKMFPLSEQETTDFEKCLYSVRAPLILGCGFLGGRVDHALAALSALVAYRDRPVVLLGEEDIVFHWRNGLALDLAEGTTVSLFPMQPVTGTASQGLEWPVTGLRLAPGVKVGTSNRAKGTPVSAAFDGPGMLGILPLDALDQVAAALSTPER